MILTVRHNCADMRRVLADYQKLGRYSTQYVCEKQGAEFARELFNQFSRIKPTKREIAAAAAARSWRMGRVSTPLTSAVKGISLAAMTRARALLGSEKSDFFKVGDGGMKIRPVRFSGRQSAKVLRGGRHGYRFAQSARRHFDVLPSVARRSMAEAGGRISRLNLRALASAIEAGYRARGSGLMALQWLPNVFRKRKSATVKGGGLMANTRDGRLLGRVDLVRGRDGLPAGVRFLGYVRGTAIQMARHSIFERTVSARLADIRKDILRNMSKAAMKAGLASPRH